MENISSENTDIPDFIPDRTVSRSGGRTAGKNPVKDKNSLTFFGLLGILIVMFDIRKSYKKLYKKIAGMLYRQPSSFFDQTTMLPHWTTGDIVAHLAANAQLKLSAIYSLRESESNTIQSTDGDFEVLSALIDRSNEEWISLIGGLHPRMIVDFFKYAYPKMLEEFSAISDLTAPGVHHVAWIHDDVSPWWLDIGREYTELWIHGMQLLTCLDDDTLLDEEFFIPFIQICFYALESHFRSLFETKGYRDFVLGIRVDSFYWELSCRHRCFLFRRINHSDYLDLQNQAVFDQDSGGVTGTIALPAAVIWKIFGGIQLSEEELKQCQKGGNPLWGDHFCALRCVMVGVA